MDTIEMTGKTVEEAIETALHELQIGRNNAQVDIINEPSSGFLGFLGNRDAKVRVYVKTKAEDFVPEFLAVLLDLIGLRADVHLQEITDGIRYYQIRGNNLGVLIGKRGQTLYAVQFLVNIAFHRYFKNGERIMLDIENYRQRRENTLKRVAVRTAEKVLETGRAITLEPMSPQERRIIHMALTDNNKIETYSTGDEPNRKVVIAPN